jgi:hypothetical protein
MLAVNIHSRPNEAHINKRTHYLTVPIYFDDECFQNDFAQTKFCKGYTAGSGAFKLT